MVYDRAAVQGAVAARTDPAAVFARAELAVAEARLRRGGGAAEAVPGVGVVGGLDFRAAINQQLYGVHRRLAQSAIRTVKPAAELETRAGHEPHGGDAGGGDRDASSRSRRPTSGRDDLGNAARCLRTVIERYGRHEYPLSALAVLAGRAGAGNGGGRRWTARRRWRGAASTGGSSGQRAGAAEAVAAALPEHGQSAAQDADAAGGRAGGGAAAAAGAGTGGVRAAVRGGRGAGAGSEGRGGAAAATVGVSGDGGRATDAGGAGGGGGQAGGGGGTAAVVAAGGRGAGVRTATAAGGAGGAGGGQCSRRDGGWRR